MEGGVPNRLAKLRLEKGEGNMVWRGGRGEGGDLKAGLRDALRHTAPLPALTWSSMSNRLGEGWCREAITVRPPPLLPLTWSSMSNRLGEGWCRDAITVRGPRPPCPRATGPDSRRSRLRALKASSPLVGSSRSSTRASVTSSMPIETLLGVEGSVEICNDLLHSDLGPGCGHCVDWT